ncbi:MAG: hypothetical protein KTR21_14605 [Rhodobacteraceae bacterium]|nr:hypothetical protein [Paracoccaceae bacterium]
MKIKQIELYSLGLPYSGGVYRLSGGRDYRSFDATFVRLETDNGIEGWGESTPFESTYIASHAPGARAGSRSQSVRPADTGLDVSALQAGQSEKRAHTKSADAPCPALTPSRAPPMSFRLGC